MRGECDACREGWRDEGQQLSKAEWRTFTFQVWTTHRKGLRRRRGELDRLALRHSLEELRELSASDADFGEALQVQRPSGVVGSAVLRAAPRSGRAPLGRGLSHNRLT